MKSRDFLSLAKSMLAAVIVVSGFIGLAYLGYRVTPDVAFISIVAVFAFVFALTSSRLRQVTAPGGFSAEFQMIATSTAESGAISPIGPADGEDFVMISKRGLPELEAISRRLSEGDFVALRLRMGPHAARYHAQQVREYVNTLAAITRNAWVLLLDPDNRFLAAAEAASLSKLPERTMHELMMALQEGDIPRLKRLPPFKHASAKIGIDNREALRLMSAERVDFLVLVDAEQMPRRIATRAQITERLLLALTK